MTLAGTMPRPWRVTLTACAVTIAVLLLLYRDTVLSIVAIWWRSGTYAHGFLVVPISAWLIWGKRHELAAVNPKPVWWLMGLVGAMGAAWLVARSVDVVIGQQLCLVAMLVTSIVALLGWRASRVIMFPLGFLIFAVPMGEDLLSPLMHFTAAFTVKALQLTGIPVFSEGMYITLPNGRWEVAEACSGLRYLIASVTLGFLYAYLMYRGFWRRAIFVAVSVVVPIFANGIRAYMIVMIGYLSGMRLAVGVDHIIYGWVLFGIIIGIMFYVGSFWREDGALVQDAGAAGNGPVRRPEAAPALSRTGFAALGIVVLAAVWPAMAMSLRGGSGPIVPLRLESPQPRDDWRPAAAQWDWRPRYLNPQGHLRQFYSSSGDVVSVYLEYYRDQRQGAELVDSENLMVAPKDPVWRQVSDRKVPIRLQGRSLTIREAALDSAHVNLLVWQWYWVGGHATSSDYVAKLLEAKDELFAGNTRSASVILATNFDVKTDKARRRLERFVEAMYPAIEKTLVHGGRPASVAGVPRRRAGGATHR